MSSDNLTKGLNADPVLTLLRETLVYGARNLATASTVAAISLYGIQVLPVTAASFGPVVKLTTLVEQELMDRVPSASLMANAPTLDQSSSEEIQQVPVGFRDEFLRARAEGKKNGIRSFRYIQKGNIEGLTDSAQSGIGPGHGKSTSALEAAIASKSSRSWEPVRIDALKRALANQSFNDFSNSINQQQRTASLRKLTELQLRNFMDVSFWRTPKKSEPDMAKETGDSEYYQLPKLAPGVRANLINIKLKYQEQIVNEAVYTYGFIGKRLNAELTGNQDLPAAEAKFVSDHLNAVRLAKPADKTQALLRLGSEPYIQLPVLLPSAPPVVIAPQG